MKDLTVKNERICESNRVNYIPNVIMLWSVKIFVSMVSVPENKELKKKRKRKLTSI